MRPGEQHLGHAGRVAVAALDKTLHHITFTTFKHRAHIISSSKIKEVVVEEEEEEEEEETACAALEERVDMLH